MSRVRVLVLALNFAVVCAGLLYQAFQTGILRFNYPSRQEFPVQGLDVSHHQGVVDWSAVPGDKVQFVFLKATEGGDFGDTMFQANWEGAREQGILVGAYHFYTFCRPVEDQIAHFFSVVPVDPDALPPVLDLEFGGNCKDVPTQEKLLRDLELFSARVFERYGAPPILYVTEEMYTRFLDGEFGGHHFWFRDVFSRPDRLPDGRDWTFWQFTNRGHIDGIDGVVDQNVFRGSLEQLRGLRAPRRSVGSGSSRAVR